MAVAELVDEFFADVSKGEIEIYNEPSLQYELGCYLRNSARQYKVQFERPVSFFGLGKERLAKKEIDIAAFTPDHQDRVAIEVKYPRNGQYPEQMFKFCQDIEFLEQLTDRGFEEGHFVVAVDDPLFWEGPSATGIYGPFRGRQTLTGTITKPTGKRDEMVKLCGSYGIDWRQAGAVRYARVSISRRTTR